MKKTKLLHIQLLPLLSGVQKKMLFLLNSLDRDKYEIYVICRPGGSLVDKLKEHGYHYLPVRSLRRNISLWDPVAMIKIFLLCRRYQFDIVHTHSSKTGFLGRIAARVAGVPKIVHTVSGFPFHAHQFFLARYLYIFLEMIAGLFCDHIAVVNKYEKDWVLKKKILPSRKVLTIYNGMEAKPYVKPRKYGKKGMTQPAKTIPELDDFFVFGTIARFSEQKNIINMTQVAISVCRNNPEIKFVFVGDGELWDKCFDMVASAGMNHRIMMPGWQYNIEKWLMNMDVFVCYSYWEGLSIAILEAMSYALPIVASDIKGNNEQVDNDNGILIPLDDHVRLRKTLLDIPGRKDDLERWSRNSLTKCNTLFSLHQFVNSYEKLYKGD